MNRLVFLVGRRLARQRARFRAAQERARLARTTVAGPTTSTDAAAPDAALPTPAGAATPGAATPDAASPAAVGGTLFLLAHQDDDLLFASTRLGGELAAGRPVTTVYLTAGDDDDEEWYWRAREAGVRAAYAHLAGVEDRWAESPVPFGDAFVHSVSLVQRADVRLLFVRLPDGGVEGQGGQRSGGASLRKLWEGGIATLSTVDGSATHSLATLHALLAELFARVRPSAIVTLDHSGEFGDGDHSDHHVVAFLARSLHEGPGASASFTGYVGYPVAERPSNLDQEQIAAKEAAFFLYALSDYKTCSTVAACSVRPEGAWLTREYVAGVDRHGVAGVDGRGTAE